MNTFELALTILIGGTLLIFLSTFLSTHFGLGVTLAGTIAGFLLLNYIVSKLDE